MKIRSAMALLLISGLALGGCTNTAQKETNATITVKEHNKGRNKLDIAEQTMYLNDPILVDWESKSNADYQLSFEYIEKIDGVTQRQELTTFPIEQGKQNKILGFDAEEIIEDDGTTNFVYKIVLGTLEKGNLYSVEKEGVIPMDKNLHSFKNISSQVQNGKEAVIGEMGIGDIKALYVTQMTQGSEASNSDLVQITSIEDIIDSKADYIQAIFLRVEETSTALIDPKMAQSPTTSPQSTQNAEPSASPSPTASEQPSESPSPSISPSASVTSAVTQK